MTATVETFARIDRERAGQVLALVDAVADADGVRPLSEHVLLHLRYGGDEPVRNLLATTNEEGRPVLVGYAHLDVTDRVEGSSAELTVHPSYRNRGIGRALAEAALAATPDGRLRLWAHGEHPGAEALARRLGFERSRVLWQMRRPLHTPLPAAVWPDGVTVRTFRVGEDEEAWLAVNNAAFADHPDQGRWDLQSVRVREQEPWFDPAGFFLAERSGRLVGFHWTKVHGGDEHHGHDPIGEVYVVGVAPEAQGLGLGKALTITGLRHLRKLGLSQAMLYVDESNRAAIAVYEGLGFTRWDTDVSYRR